MNVCACVCLYIPDFRRTTEAFDCQSISTYANGWQCNPTRLTGRSQVWDADRDVTTETEAVAISTKQKTWLSGRARVGHLLHLLSVFLTGIQIANCADTALAARVANANPDIELLICQPATIKVKRGTKAYWKRVARAKWSWKENAAATKITA